MTDASIVACDIKVWCVRYSGYSEWMNEHKATVDQFSHNSVATDLGYGDVVDFYLLWNIGFRKLKLTNRTARQQGHKPETFFTAVR